MWLRSTNNALKRCRFLFGKPVSLGKLEQNTLSLLVNNWHRLSFRPHLSCPITESYCVEGMSNFRVSTKKWRCRWIAIVCDYCTKQPTRGCTIGTHLLSPAVLRTVAWSWKLSDRANMWHKKMSILVRVSASCPCVLGFESRTGYQLFLHPVLHSLYSQFTPERYW